MIISNSAREMFVHAEYMRRVIYLNDAIYPKVFAIIAVLKGVKGAARKRLKNSGSLDL